MDWSSLNFDWNRARAFLVTAEEGSFSAAARALSMSQPTLGRQVSALEEELDVVLFERVGRNLELTANGLELVEHVRAMANAATHVSLTASGQAQSIEGTIRITASEAYSAFVLPPLVARLRQLQPGIVVEIVASNEVSDLRRREADIAIRNAQPVGQDLVGKKLRSDFADLFASKDYLARVGKLECPADLSRAQFVGFEDNDQFLAGLNRKGLGLSPASFPVLTSNHLVNWELVKQGVGIGVMASHIGEAEPSVCRAVPWIEPFKFPVWLVAHREVKTSRRVRLVFDFLAEEMARLQT
ncbi:MAG: LysR family transcriptional regulator [Alphaproteobacteria bacterium]|nr:LysR family transcriptional regulator [Alphaproteobacteria bacterium]